MPSMSVGSPHTQRQHDWTWKTWASEPVENVELPEPETRLSMWIWLL
jgi:hypothetical protein